MKQPTTDLEIRIAQARFDIEMGNNGYAFIGHDDQVAAALREQGFDVRLCRNLHGNLEYKGFTAASVAALRKDPNSVSPWQPVTHFSEVPDYEAAILARQANFLLA